MNHRQARIDMRPPTMFSIHRHQRCQVIVLALPPHESAKDGKTMRELLPLVAHHYGECKTEEARVRSLQKDLQHLCAAGDIVAQAAPGERTAKRYRRAAQERPPSGNVNLNALYADLLQRGVPPELAGDLVQRMEQTSHPRSYLDLPPAQLITVPDTVRLAPKHPPDATLQAEIVTALHLQCVLNASYRKPGSAQAGARRLHPLGVLLRGPQHYLIAYDEKDLTQPNPPAKMFAVQRLEDVAALTDTPARIPPGASLAAQVREPGYADFARDSRAVTLKLRVWDYLMQLLEDHQIAPNQTFQRARNGESATVTAKVVPSGTLFRWLLGFGDKVEVLKPLTLRSAIAWQASSATEYYEDVYEAEGETGDDSA